MSGTGSDNGWLEAAIAWEVCASLHRQYCKGKDALFTTRQSDFVKHAENARGRASHGQAPAGATKPTEQQILEAAEKAGLWPNTVHSWIPAFHRYHKELAKAQPAPAQPDSVLGDAANYRWIRDGGDLDAILKTVKDPGKWETPYAVLLQGDELDAAIAAARKQGGA